ncbi:MAG TPA: sigma-70 family RNA polymerase sigma factor [Candidatus Tectomicrobia bacterium]|jgi:RNA polymerase sigma-70 factor (ECF subfamily)
MPYDEDFSLIRRVAAKDRQAFECLYQQYYSRLMGYVGKLLSRRELAEDVVHEVMMVVWNDSARFRYTSRLSTWLFGIAYHKALKAQARTAEKPLDRPPVAPTSLDQEDPADAVTRQETHKALVHAIQALSPEQRAVVELTFYHDRSYQEIAAIVGCPVNTVKTRMLYARKRLAQLLSASDMTKNLE